jgi:hypothetical protein
VTCLQTFCCVPRPSTASNASALGTTRGSIGGSGAFARAAFPQVDQVWRWEGLGSGFEWWDWASDFGVRVSVLGLGLQREDT